MLVKTNEEAKELEKSRTGARNESTSHERFLQENAMAGALAIFRQREASE